MNGKLIRNLGIVAVALVAAVALACGGSSLDDKASSEFGGDGDTALQRGEGETGATSNTGAPAVAAEEPAPARDDAAGGALGPGGSPVETLQTADRKIVHTASLQLQVEEVGASFEEVGRIATAAGGFVASSSFSYRDGEPDGELQRQVASVTIRVPSEAYPGVLTQLRGLAEVVDYEESQASDVTEQYTDLQSRLRNLEATETQLLRLLERAESISDILTVQDRLNQVRGEIEQVKGRIQLLDDLTDLATVTVHLRPVDGAPVPNGDDGGVNLGQTISEAWDDSLAFLGSIAEGVLTVVVFAWWVPVIGAPLGIIAWAASRGRRTATSAVD